MVVCIEESKEQQKDRTKAKPTSVAVKPDFVRKALKDLTMQPSGAKGRGKKITGYQARFNKTMLTEPKGGGVCRINKSLTRTLSHNGPFEREHEAHCDKERAQRQAEYC